MSKAQREVMPKLGVVIVGSWEEGFLLLQRQGGAVASSAALQESSFDALLLGVLAVLAVQRVRRQGCVVRRLRRAGFAPSLDGRLMSGSPTGSSA